MLTSTLLVLALVQRTALDSATTRAPGRLDLVPDDAAFVVTCADVPGLRATAQQNTFVRLAVDEPDIAHEFGFPISSEFALALTPDPSAEALAGLDDRERERLELIEAVGGGVTFYLSTIELFFNRDLVNGVIVEADAGLDTIVDFAQRELSTTEQPLEFVERENGVSVGLKSSRSSVREAILVADGTFVHLNSPNEELLLAEVERVAAKLGGNDGPSLLNNAAFAEARNALTAPGQIDLFVHLEPWIEKETESELEGNADDRTVQFIEGSGVRDIRWLAGRFGVGAGEALDGELRLHIPKNSLLALAANQLRPIPRDLMYAVPTDARSVVGLHYDLAGLLAGAFTELEDMSDELVEMFRMQLELASSIAGVDVEADLVALFTGRAVRAVEYLREGDEAEDELPLASSTTPGTWLFEVRDAATVMSSIEDLSYGAAVSVELESTEIDGREVFPPTAGFLPRWWTADGPTGGGFLSIGSHSGRMLGLLDAALGEPSQRSILDDPQLGPLVSEHADTSYFHAGRSADMISGGMALFRGVGSSQASMRDMLAEHLRGVFWQSLERTPTDIRYHFATR